MVKKAKQIFADASYRGMTVKIDNLIGIQPNDNFYISSALAPAISNLISEHGGEEYIADFLLMTFDNLLEEKAPVMLYPFVNKALQDSEEHKAADRLINGLRVFLSQKCMVSVKPSGLKFPVPDFV